MATFRSWGDMSFEPTTDTEMDVRAGARLTSRATSSGIPASHGLLAPKSCRSAR